MTLSNTQFQETFTISGSSTNSLDLPFKFFADSEIKVTVNGSGFTAFTLEGAGRDSGVRRLTRTSGNFADADSVVVTRIVDGLQDFDPSTGQVLDVEGIEDALDKATGFAQQSLRVDTTNGQTFDASIDGSAAKIVNVATGTADGDAVNKAQLDLAVAGISGGSGASVTIPTPDAGSGDDNKILAVNGTGYALQTPSQVRSDMSLGTSDNVTHNNIIASGTITVAGASDLNGTMNVQGDATFQADVNVGDDLQLPAAGHIKAATGGVGINVDSNAAGGSFHVRKSGTASSFPSGTNVIVAEAGDADFSAVTVMGPSRANGQEHDIRFAAADSVGLTTAIRSTRGASQPADSLSLFANAKEIVKISSDGTDGLLDLSGGGTSSTTLISGVHEPSASSDAATKNYVDTQIASNTAEVTVVQFVQEEKVFTTLTAFHSLTPIAAGSGSYNGITSCTITPASNKFTLPAGTYLLDCDIDYRRSLSEPQRGPQVNLTTDNHASAASLTGAVTSAGGTRPVRGYQSVDGGDTNDITFGLGFKDVITLTGTQDLYVTVGQAFRTSQADSKAFFFGRLVIQKLA